jgi:RNA polymerase sigma-70 factor, ECF subfamily
MNSISENEAVQRARCGDRDALECVYKSYRRKVYLLCLGMMRNADDAEDLMQDTFVRVLTGIHTFRGDAQLGTWIYRVARNIVLMRLRKSKRSTHPAADFGESGFEAGRNDDLAALAVEPTLDAADRFALARAIRQLAPNQRRVLLLHDVLGYGHGEIGRLIRTSEANSKSRLWRARRKLRGILSQQPDRHKQGPKDVFCARTEGVSSHVSA